MKLKHMVSRDDPYQSEREYETKLVTLRNIECTAWLSFKLHAKETVQACVTLTLLFSSQGLSL